MGCKVKELRFGLHKCRTPVPQAYRVRDHAQNRRKFRFLTVY